VYLACTVIFISLAGTLLFTIQRSVQSQARFAERWVELAVALNVVCSIGKDAPREKIFWKVMESDRLIFRTQEGDRGIMIENGRLVGIRGMYSSLNGYWVSRSHSVLLENAFLAMDCEMLAGKIVGIAINLSALCGTHDLRLHTFMAVS
jgi:hypothetical protein